MCLTDSHQGVGARQAKLRSLSQELVSFQEAMHTYQFEEAILKCHFRQQSTIVKFKTQLPYYDIEHAQGMYNLHYFKENSDNFKISDPFKIYIILQKKQQHFFCNEILP